MRELNPADWPVDLAMGRKLLETITPCYNNPYRVVLRGMDIPAPHPDADDMAFEYRDRSNDEAEEILREESEYWHGMSVVGPEWFFQLEN